MFGISRKRPVPDTAVFSPATPLGALVYAVGDIHGRADLLNHLVEMLRADSSRLADKYKPVLVFLGDYVDRGPDSRRVISDIITLKSDPWFRVFALRGNHDQIFLDFLSDPQLGPNWLNYGGGATMLSYGVTPPRQTDIEGWARASEALAAAVPPEHVDFIANAPLYTWLGDYLFVHAGVRPEVGLADQTETDLMSIRGGFLNAPVPSPGRVVVFGHTPFERPLVEPHKIGLDTGACATGVLTALAIKDGERRFLQTGTPDRIWPVPDMAAAAGNPRRL